MGDQGAEARSAAIADLVFARGGMAGAIRRIIFGWFGRFSAAQISIALRRRWPLLTPNKHQVADCLDWLEKRRFTIAGSNAYTKTFQILFTTPVTLPSGAFNGSWAFQNVFTRTLSNP